MATKKKMLGEPGEVITIRAPRFMIVKVPIRGTSNFVSNAFPEEARTAMADEMRKGSVDKKRGGRGKPPKDFQKGFLGSMHVTDDNKPGIPCTAFRASMVRAAQLCGVEMTKAKMCVFVEPDDVEKGTGNGLVLFKKGKAQYLESYVRNANGSADIRARARFAPGWEMTVTIRYNADFLSHSSVINLLMYAGISVGVGAGRPFSTASVGQGWGTFEIIGNDVQAAAE